VNTSIYAKPVAPRIIYRPILATLLLHGLMLYFLTVNWSDTEREVTHVKPAPRVINARLVDVSDFKPKPKPKPKAKPKARTKPKSKPVAKPKPKPKPKPQAGLRAEVANCEARVNKLEEMRDNIDRRLGNKALYERGDHEEIEKWTKKRKEVMQGLERAESLWMKALEKLERG